MDDAELWRQIESSGPLDHYATTFDPLSVDDVLQAERTAAQYDRRRAFFTDYAWAVPTRAAIDAIVRAVGDRRVIEVCAGNGLWARLLASAGVSIVATDAAAPPHPWLDIQICDAAEAVHLHPECEALLLCWPPFNDPPAYRALQAFQGGLLVYVGDRRFTGDRRFHELLDVAWEIEHSLPLPSWPGTDDYVHVYRRR